MEAHAFDNISIHVAHGASRRSLLRALGTLGAALALSATQPDTGLARKRKRKCKRPRVKCGKACLSAGSCCTNAECAAINGQVCAANRCECPSGESVSGSACTRLCSPACAECETCDNGVCVDAPGGLACANGGFCRNGVCKPDQSFGCVAAQNGCQSGSGVTCPDSITSGAICFIDADGDPICGKGICTNVTTDEACEALAGDGAFALVCPICQIVSRTHTCVKAVKE